MEILDGMEIIDTALYLKRHETLVISDLHIGIEEALNKQGILVPRTHFKDMIRRLEKITSKVAPKKIVINGDIKHEFGEISDQEWRETLKIIDFCSEFGEVVLVKGNHDKVLGPIAKKRKVTTRQEYIMKDIMMVHGDRLIEAPKTVRTIITGHEHPAISLKDQARSEIYKCFLKGRYKGKNLIVMPSFNSITYGSDLTGEKTFSPYIGHDKKNFEVFVAEENKTLYFGKLKDLN
jgi:putative SbcD/Mre11-related phosphoesterase